MKKFALVAWLVALLCGCGGGGGSTDTSDQSPVSRALAVPSNISAIQGDGQVTVMWSPVANATSYHIYWGNNPQVSKSSGKSITLSSTQTQYVHSGLFNGTAYYYVVTAVSGLSESDDSMPVSSTPAAASIGAVAPSFMSVSAGNREVSLTWRIAPSATSYNLYWSTNPGVSKTTGTMITVSAQNTYIHRGLTNGTTYYYIVTAVNSGGESNASVEVSATPAPGVPPTPTGITSTAGAGSVTISWNPVATATSYNIYWSNTPGVTSGTGTKISGIASPSYTHSVSSGAYYYVVTAVDGGFESVASSETSSKRFSVTRVAGGSSHAVAVLADGTLWSWGDNTAGQLGDPVVTHKRSIPVQMAGGATYTAIAARERFSAALRNDGTVWTWGENTVGQLGDGTTTARFTPVAVAGPSGIIGIVAGKDQGFALQNDGSIWTWGNNLAPYGGSHVSGQLGVGLINSSATAAKVAGITAVKIAGGPAHVAALKSDGTVWTWGCNSSGQLGDGTTTDRTAPVQVPGLAGMTDIAAVEERTYALKSDGTVWAWGENATGQLGDGTTTNKYAPVRVNGISGVIALAAGESYLMVLKSDGSVWGWGDNSSGQLGNGTTTSSKVPVKAVNLTGVTAIAAGNATMFAITPGKLWIWGRNTSGQLGNGTFIDSNVPKVCAYLSSY